MAEFGPKKRTYLIFPALCTLACSAFAAQCPQPTQADTSHPNNTLPAQGVVLESDSLSTQDRSRVKAEGDVAIRTPTEAIFADEADYEHKTGDLTLRGDVRIQQRGGTIKSEQVDYNVSTRTGKFSNNQFTFPRTTAKANESKQINGSANAIEQGDGGVLTLKQATYTTCKTPNPDWALHASKIKLDQTNGVGSAKHMRLHIGSVPVFYWPYINFPIDDRRKTGFLFPNFSSNSRNGITYSQPFYWNIRPNADATLTWEQGSKSGSGQRTQWRYLDRFGTYTLYLDGQQDRANKNASIKDDRWFGQFLHQGQWQQNTHSEWQTAIDIKRVSDKDYLDDFDNSNNVSNATHLVSTASLSNTLRGEHVQWQNTLGIQTHQTPDETLADASKPYDKAPYFNSRLQSVALPAQLDLNTQWAHFTHPTKTNTKRLDAYPSASYTLETSYGFLTPKVGARFTQYAQDDGTDASRSTAIASLDSGLTLDKHYKHLTHSISPRAYFLYVPFKDQSNLPLFDTSDKRFSYNNLFSENRFTGIDRQGDAQQVTLGLSNQWQSRNTGLTRAKIDIARAFYKEPQRVGLNATHTSNTAYHSDIAGRAQFGLTQATQLDATWQYSTEHDGLIDSRYTVRHQRNGNQFFAGYEQENTYTNGHRTSDTTLADVGAYWNLSPAWTVMGLGVYNITDSREQELSLGIQYKDCCWGVSLVAKHELDDGTPDDPDDYDQSYFLQFSLDGLANVGRDSNDLIQRIQNR